MTNMCIDFDRLIRREISSASCPWWSNVVARSNITSKFLFLINRYHILQRIEDIHSNPARLGHVQMVELTSVLINSIHHISDQISTHVIRNWRLSYYWVSWYVHIKRVALNGGGCGSHTGCWLHLWNCPERWGIASSNNITAHCRAIILISWVSWIRWALYIKITAGEVR